MIFVIILVSALLTQSQTYIAIRVILRGKAQAEWKVIVSGDRRTVKDDQIFIEDRCSIWGKGKYLICFEFLCVHHYH